MDRTEPARYLPLVVFGPLGMAACVAAVVQGLPAASLVLGTAVFAGAAAACAAAWKGERWELLVLLGVGAAVAAAFFTFGIGATFSVGGWLVDPCNGSCPPY